MRSPPMQKCFSSGGFFTPRHAEFLCRACDYEDADAVTRRTSKVGGDVDLTVHEESGTTMLHLASFHGSLKMVRGTTTERDDAFSKIREDANSTRCVATWCNTIMLFDNGFYHQVRVALPPVLTLPLHGYSKLQHRILTPPPPPPTTTHHHHHHRLPGGSRGGGAIS